jgi:hypothetical protein
MTHHDTTTSAAKDSHLFDCDQFRILGALAIRHRRERRGDGATGRRVDGATERRGDGATGPGTRPRILPAADVAHT